MLQNMIGDHDIDAVIVKRHRRHIHGVTGLSRYEVCGVIDRAIAHHFFEIALGCKMQDGAAIGQIDGFAFEADMQQTMALPGRTIGASSIPARWCTQRQKTAFIAADRTQPVRRFHRKLARIAQPRL